MGLSNHPSSNEMQQKRRLNPSSLSLSLFTAPVSLTVSRAGNLVLSGQTSAIEPGLYRRCRFLDHGRDSPAGRAVLTDNVQGSLF